MWAYRLLYSVKATQENFRQYGATLLVSLAAVSFTMLLLASYVLLLGNLKTMETRLGENLQITVYLEKGLADDGRKALEAAIGATTGVDSVRFISAGEALHSLKAALGDSARILDGLEENPLPSSLEVRLQGEHRKLAGIRTLAAAFSSMKGVAEVEYGGEWIERFFAFVKILRWLGLGLGFLLLGATVVVISSTLTLSFFARKEEIEILRLVGATELHVRLPFLVEAMLQGIGGAMMSVGALWLLYQVFRLNLEGSWGMLAGWGGLRFLSPAAVVGLVSLGVLVGVLSSLVCFSRFSARQ